MSQEEFSSAGVAPVRPCVLSPADLPASFFRRLGPGQFEPTEATVGPWSIAHQHGGPPIALLAHALRHHEPRPGMVLARLTVEILGPVPVEPCTVKVRTVRPGRRIELLEAELCVRDRPMLLARAWRLEEVSGISPSAPDAASPLPLPPEQPQRFFPGVDYFPYGHALEWRFARGGFEDLGPAFIWARPRIALVEGEPLHGTEGLLTLLDSANGVSCELDIRRWTFVPVDLTLNLMRQPEGPWYALEARTVTGPDGIGVVHTTVFDAHGPAGRSLHTLFVRPRSSAA